MCVSGQRRHCGNLSLTLKVSCGSDLTLFDLTLFGISLRSGEAMENALRECCQGVKIGKVLVQR